MAVRAGTIGLGVVLGDTILCVFAVAPGGPDDHRSYGRKRRVTTPRRGLLFHFTHMSNLAAIVRDGLRCDSEVTDTERVFTEVGNQVIKSRRRVRCVPVPPGGVVADYVPFYFAARSPMLYAVHMGSVAEYKGGQDDLVYLVSSIAAVAEHCLAAVFCDRNATLEVARYGTDPAVVGRYVDWELMEARWWHNTPQEPDRMERRMAEWLAHRHVPWSAIIGVAARTEERSRHASAALATVGATTIVRSRPEWYF